MPRITVTIDMDDRTARRIEHAAEQIGVSEAELVTNWCGQDLRDRTGDPVALGRFVRLEDWCRRCGDFDQPRDAIQ